MAHWVARYDAEGQAGLHDRSSRPRTSPRRTSAEVEDAVVALYLLGDMRLRAALAVHPLHEREAAMKGQPGISVRHETSGCGD